MKWSGLCLHTGLVPEPVTAWLLDSERMTPQTAKGDEPYSEALQSRPPPSDISRPLARAPLGFNCSGLSLWAERPAFENTLLSRML